MSPMALQALLCFLKLNSTMPTMAPQQRFSKGYHGTYTDTHIYIYIYRIWVFYCVMTEYCRTVIPCSIKTISLRAPQAPSFFWVYHLYQVLPSLSSFTKIYQVLPSFYQVYQVLPSFTKFYQVLPSFTKLYQVLPSFTKFTKFYQVLPSFTKFYQVLPSLPSFTKFYQALPSFTKFYQVLPSFT